MDSWKKVVASTFLTICFSRAKCFIEENRYSQQKSWQK